MSDSVATNKEGVFTRFLNSVERVGNRMCSPVTLYLIICLIIVLCSAIFQGATIQNPSTGEAVTITSLLTFESIVWMLTSFCENIANFPTLIYGLVVVMGIGLFENTGMASALTRASVLKAPDKLIVPLLLLISVSSNIAGDAGFLIMPMVGAMVFAAKNKSPIAGMALCYAGVAGGYSANFLVGTADALLIGFTDSAAKILDPNYEANIMCNWYFMAASVVLIVIVGVFVNKKFVEPRMAGSADVANDGPAELTEQERKGLKAAGIAELVFFVIVIAACIPADSPFRDEVGALFGVKSGLIGGVIPLIMLVFLIPAAVYGFKTGIFKNDKNLVEGVEKAVSSFSGYVVFCIIAAQMIAYFNKSKMGVYLAIAGAKFLTNINLTGPLLFVAFILLCGLINILIASASAKWAFMSTIFVPMFMLLGYDPSLTQVLFRLGDSITNPITPMLAYFAMMVALAARYDKKSGFGSLISALLPYSIAFFLVWTAFFIVWYLLGIPLGPGSTLFYVG